MKFYLITYVVIATLTQIVFTQLVYPDSDCSDGYGSYSRTTASYIFPRRLCFSRSKAPYPSQHHGLNIALNKFSLQLLAETSNQIEGNLALSPYTVWSVMSMICKGARGNTEEELQKLLGIGSLSFSEFQKNITKNLDNAVVVDIYNAIFVTLGKILKPNYRQLIQKEYGAEILQLDFRNISGVTKFINKKISEVTRNRVQNILDEDVVRGAELIIASALFFKGLWNRRFVAKYTSEQPFYNENGIEISKVSMMVNQGLPVVSVLDKQADAIELPYLGGSMSMIVFLPRKDVKLSSILHTLSQTPITQITKSLKDVTNFEDNMIHLPKFKISTELNVKDILRRLGVRDVFSVYRADLSGISPDQLFISEIRHAAEIEVDEEGTEASGASLGIAIPVMIPPTYRMNKPFAFIIFDKITNSIVFVGKLITPRANGG